MNDDIAVIRRGNKAYPAALREITDPPDQLYVRGNDQILNHPHLLAVVGSRKANTYGQQCIALLLPSLVHNGVVLVSGLAFGIDSMAHRVSVAASSPTIAVLGGGVDDSVLYPPSHKALAQNILKYDGAIISEYPPGTPARAHRFPERNRIIAGLCQAVLVVQANTRSGSLITARLGLESNRDVLAVPGPINDPYSLGTNDLIQAGAAPAIRPQDIFDALDIEPSAGPAEQKHLRADHNLVLQHLTVHPRHVDEITAAVKLTAASVAALLTELELLDQVQHVGGMKYVKKT